MMNVLQYRRADISDFKSLYLIKCDSLNIKWGGYTKAPDYNDFFEWYKLQLRSNSRRIFLVYENEEICAFFYIDKLRDKLYGATSQGVISKYTGRGIGTYCINMSLLEIRRWAGNMANVCVEAWCAEDNIASFKRFEKCGFIKTEVFDHRVLPLLSGEHRFYKWIKRL